MRRLQATNEEQQQGYDVLGYSILLFVALLTVIHWIKPNPLYASDGSFRNFGVGSASKTVISMWVACIALSLLCYLGVKMLIRS